MIEKLNLTMLTDYYEITMANGYFESDLKDDIAVFDLFFRTVPDGGGYAIMAGLEQAIHYLENLKFTDKDIEYLKRKGCFGDKFLEYLRNFKFECDVWAIPEGTPIFPNEPLMTVRGPVIQAQFVETMLLLLINHQSLIATKASRIVYAAGGRGVMEFGTRRAHGVSAAVYGARAAYIGGCTGTACAISDRDFGVEALGTMAHSWVQMFPTEYEAFRKYAEVYPDNCTFLVDTYNVLKSGVPNAIRIFDEMKPDKKGIRIDSGDIAYLTKQARKMLDDAGHTDCKIIVSNSMDEYVIQDILMEGACVDSFGVGERLITSKSTPVFGGVYKLVALEQDGELISKIKVSENIEKITNPGFKKLYRLYDKESGKALADVISLHDEPAPDGEEYEIFDPNAVWKRKKISNYEVKELQVPIFEKGQCVYDRPDIEEIKAFCKDQMSTIWAETRRLEKPQTYYVDLSEKLFTVKNSLLENARK